MYIERVPNRNSPPAVLLRESYREGDNVVWVTDRGILTNAKINELVKPIEGLDYISGLTKPQIRKLAEVEAVQLGLFDQKKEG